MYDKIKLWYEKGLWDEAKVRQAYEKGLITEEQMAEILGGM